ncbi:Mak10 subunit, NatC N-terminal acetyltransferase-domain-containing protein [Sphaerosporella brunnea]|uniref:Mak10 subunit, NatC N-terminal acetyltransferase-domain-containing protein n=1 Tax=Sphaerosporella brunnea TaxID=1250544 RepID=A0A5J5F8C8_9PEZI|nr:Mak10 subunit, NatC N-terminal acetyltransferase-domain-containing protein [Sphaerosporella brunnea]
MTTFRDVTKEFLEASGKLNVGQLVQDPDFTLFQAVGALEIMDPKMDSGLLEPEYERFYAWAPRLPEEIIGIMDHLLCNEMAWHLGSALSQTLFANLYIDKLLSSSPMKLEQATFGTPPREPTPGQEIVLHVLQPYCLALIKCCGYMAKQVPSEHIYEEEDFVPQTYGLPLLQNIEHAEIVVLLDSALQWLVDNEAALSKELAAALRNRLKLRKLLLEDFAKDGESYHEGATSNWVENMLKILNYAGASNTMTYFMHFSARRPTPLPYSRSLLQSLLMKDMKVLGRMPLKCILFDDIQELAYPVKELLDPKNFEVEAPQSPKYQIAKRMDWFVERAGRSYIELYRNFCQNRARLRRILCKAVLDWDSLQVESEEIDSELRDFTNEAPVHTRDGPLYSFSLSSWVYHYKLRIMELIILLGFELDIFPLHEFDGMYWYLQFYLRTRSGHVDRMRSFVRTPPKGEDQEGYNKTISMLNYTLLEIAAMQDLASACVYLYCALNRRKVLGKPKTPYGDDLLRYEGRMKPFLSIGCPEVIAYDTFRSVVDNEEMEMKEILSYANDHIAEAKKQYQKMSKLPASIVRANICYDSFRTNVNCLLRSCVGVGVAIGVLSREDGPVEVTLDHGDKYHPAFPVPCIKVKS